MSAPIIPIEDEELTSLTGILWALAQMKLSVVPFHMPTAIDRVVLEMRDRALDKGVSFTSQIEGDVRMFSGDERKATQIMRQLLLNALKFTPSGGRVAIVTTAIENGVQVAVSSADVGITVDELTVMFEALKQGEVDRLGQGGRLLLELLLSHRCIELHKGRIWLESEIAKGSTFFFTLVSQA